MAYPHETEASIDLSVIQELRQLSTGSPGETDLVRELVALFTRQTPKSLAELSSALKSGNSKSIERVAHTLKSSAANLGAKRMSAIAAKLEAKAAGRVPASQLPEGVEREEELLSALSREYERVEQELQLV